MLFVVVLTRLTYGASRTLLVAADGFSMPLHAISFVWNGFVVKRRLVVATVARRWKGRVFHALASVATSKWRCPVRLGTFDAQEFAHHIRKLNVCSTGLWYWSPDLPRSRIMICLRRYASCCKDSHIFAHYFGQKYDSVGIETQER